MKLITLGLKNFKGERAFELIAKGVNTSVFGNNATGKTTLVDAFMWLLFNKDSTDRADFQLKTLDQDGNEIHGLEHQVEAEIDLDGERVVLRKVFEEEWTKKRGASEAEFTGHKTKYYVDEVPRKKKEFEDYISSIIPEKVFKLVTNPLYFNSNLHWKERREIMLSICGDIESDQVFESNKALDHIKDLLRNKTTEDALKMLKAQKAKINKELDETPIRISEVSNSTPELPQTVDFKKINEELSEIQEKIIFSEKEKTDLLKNINIEQKVIYDKIAEAQKELLLIRSDKSKIEMEVKHSNQRLNDVRSLVDSKRSLIARNLASIASFEKDLETLAQQRERLLKLWSETAGEKFLMNDGNTSCKSCGQLLPEELRARKLGKLKTDFEVTKVEELASISSKGKMINTQVESYQKSIQNCKEQNAQLETELTDLEIPVSSFQADGMSVLDESIVKIEASIKDFRKELEKVNYDDFLKTVETKISGLRNDITALEKTLSLKEVYEKNQIRIEELKTRQQELSKAYLALEKQIEGVERFIKAKCDMQENTLNNMFKDVKFKLFSKNINGGIEECFETTYSGVPWIDANGAAKVNSGIEIINKLCDHYNFTAPIWVDNAESVIKLQSTNSQVIRLVVSEKDSKLRVVQGIEPEIIIESLEEMDNHSTEECTDEEFNNLLTQIKSKINDYSRGDIWDTIESEEICEKLREIRTETGERSRWSIQKTTIYGYKNKYFAVSWNDPATEMQDGQCTNCEVCEVKPVPKLITEYC